MWGGSAFPGMAGRAWILKARGRISFFPLQFLPLSLSDTQ